MSDQEIKGEEPQPADTALSAAAEILSPVKSLDRVDAHAKYLFTLVATIGTLLTGFGLVSDNPLIKADPTRLFWPLAFVCASLASAMLAMTPWAGNVNIYDLNAVAEYFGKRIRIRGVFVFLAGLLFAAALLSVLTVFRHAVPQQKPAPAQATLTLKATRGETKDDLAAAIKITGLPAGVRADIAVTATKKDGTKVPVLTQSSTRRDGGELTAEVSVPEAGTLTELRLFVLAKSDQGAEVLREDVVVKLEPRPAAPPRPRK